MVQLRRALKRNASYIWHAFEKQVSFLLILRLAPGAHVEKAEYHVSVGNIPESSGHGIKITIEGELIYMS